MDTIDLHFPFAGLDVSQAVGEQPNRPAAEGKYSRSCAVGKNVRAYTTEGRARGGNRPGLAKYIATRPGSVRYITQHLAKIVVMEDSPVQPSQSGRRVVLIAVSQGNVYYADAGSASWTAATNNTGNTPPLIATGLMQSAVSNQKLYFADGTNWVLFDPSTNSLETWTASAGSRPVDSDSNTPRLICNWRGRIILSGLLGNPNQIFATKVGDPTNFDYAPAVPVPADSAWSSPTGPQGNTGDVITALIPYTDDLLVIGMDSSMAVFRGDPMAGGSIDNVTTTIGMAWGEAWCMDPTGVVYFFSNRTGVFQFVPGQLPQRLSMPVDSLLLSVNTGEYGVRMIWNDRYKTMHVFITLLTTSFATTHYTWESQANAWWQDTFVNSDHNPLCVLVFDGNLPQDRVALIGSWDGYVRSISSTATSDDGETIDSEVWLGPFLTKYSDAVLLKEIQPVLADNSGDVAYGVFVGDTAEEALAATATVTGVWSELRNYTDTVRRSGYAAYIQLTSSVAWAMESIRAVLDTGGAIRRRGKT